MLSDLIFKYRKIKKRQSLSYQVMLILMNEHSRVRLNKRNYIGYLYGNSLSFDENEWDLIIKKILVMISSNHKNILANEKDFDNKKRYIMSILENIIFIDDYEEDFESIEVEIEKLSHKNYILLIDEDIYDFRITNSGYRYQFNGYMKSQDKSNKMSNFLNFFIVILTIVIATSSIINFLPQNTKKELYVALIDYIKIFKISYVRYSLLIILYSIVLIILKSIFEFIDEYTEISNKKPSP